MHDRIRLRRQAGMSTIGSVAALSGIMILFLIIFLIANSGSSNKTADNSSNNQQTTGNTQNQSKTNEPPYIRIPQNSLVYSTEAYGFSFAYPDSFLELGDTENTGLNILFSAQSGLAANKPVGNTGTVMNGQLGVYVYSKDTFKILVGEPDALAGPSKTGNDTTWKIVSSSLANANFSLGSPYNAKTIKSQTGVTVFDFSLKKKDNSFLGRIVFEANDSYVLVALPSLSLPNNTVLSTADTSAYTTVLSNIAKTVRVFKTTSADSTSGSSGSNSSSSGSSSEN